MGFGCISSTQKQNPLRFSKWGGNTEKQDTKKTYKHKKNMANKCKFLVGKDFEIFLEILKENFKIFIRCARLHLMQHGACFGIWTSICPKNKDIIKTSKKIANYAGNETFHKIY